ncbi:MAG TPA: GNAT family N-acetyltransferase [Myxococcales bacterium]|nr:GNAT family N-acetyltransferase [Myxococcales bacterium]
MAVTVTEVRTRGQRRAFLELPFSLHGDDPIWCPPLLDDLERSLSDKNPLWRDGRGERQLLLATDGGRPVGRVLAHVHHASNAAHGERAGFFGLFDCADDEAVARALVDEAAERHRARGLAELRGPYDLNIRECIGAVVSGFDEPAAFNQSWNAPYVPRLLEACGLKPVMKLATFRLDDVARLDPEAMLEEKHRAWLRDPRVVVRGFERSRFEEDVRAAVALLNESFRTNYGFVPMDSAEVDFMAAPMKRVVRPELTVFIELDGAPVGVGMFLPDFQVLFRRMGGRLFPLGWAKFLVGSRGMDAALAQFIATSPAQQGQGLMRIVMSELVRRMQKEGFRTLDSTWISESNKPSRAQARALGMRVKHELQLYARPLTSSSG